MCIRDSPLAAAILRRAGAQGLEPDAAADFATVPGQGVTGKVDGKPVLAGNLRMMEANGLSADRFGVDADAVSYTHLDVYKRQDKKRERGRDWRKRPAQENPSGRISAPGQGSASVKTTCRA